MSCQRWLRAYFALLLGCVLGSIAWACGGYGVLETAMLVREVGAAARQSSLVHQPRQVTESIEELRSRGPDALEALIGLRNRRVQSLGGVEFAEIENLDFVIDKVAGQKFAVQSRLFWHTSLEKAKADSRATNRPILSLRMLGRLDEDLSCANSRFFRTTLYPDPTISSVLSEHFVLHWQPVRKVPVVTIDFGDGRQLRQPLTGNSVHLVLDQKGRPFEALPGLVSPQSFRRWLDQIRQFWTSSDVGDESAFWASVAAHHQQRAIRHRSESSMAIARTQHVSDLNPLDPRWSQLAATREVVLASTSRRLLGAQRPEPAADPPMRLAASKRIVERPLLRAVEPIEPAIARDTVFNLYALQTKIDDWFAAAVAPIDDPTLTRRIYEEVFLMPLDDPWLGLSSETRFTALDQGGRIDSSASLGGGSNHLPQSARPIPASASSWPSGHRG